MKVQIYYFTLNSTFSSIFIIILTSLILLPTCFSIQLTILHYNDFHSRFQQIDASGGSCSADELEKEECFGGFARLKGKIEEIRSKFNNTLLFNAGDYFQGTLWFTIYGWRLHTHFLNQLNHTAVAIGSHEFDDGVAPYVPFLENFKYPVISCNINDTMEPAIQNKYKKSIVVTMSSGEKVGVIGYTSKETDILASPGMLRFHDVYESVGKEAQIMHDNGIKIIIGMGYNGLLEDIDMCKKVPHVNLVVGSKTQVFIYSGTPPESDEPYQSYPIVVTKPNGKPCLVVTAFAYGKYLGFLQVEYDSEGYPINWAGNPILLDNTVDEDMDIHHQLDEWEANSTQLLSEKVGTTKVLLNGKTTSCRLQECNFGNVIADSFVFMCLQFANDFQWNYVSLAILNSGGIRGSIEERKINGSITKGDVYEVLPFRNKIDIIELKGEYIWQMFEYSVTTYHANSHYPSGKFLQVSGFLIEFDMCQPPGGRVSRIRVRCNECRIPVFSPLDNNSYYQVIVPQFLAQGGDGFTVLKKHILSTHTLGFVDSDILVAYMQARGPIVQGIDQRIKIIDQCIQSLATELTSYHTILLIGIIIFGFWFMD